MLTPRFTPHIKIVTRPQNLNEPLGEHLIWYELPLHLPGNCWPEKCSSDAYLVPLDYFHHMDGQCPTRVRLLLMSEAGLNPTLPIHRSSCQTQAYGIITNVCPCILNKGTQGVEYTFNNGFMIWIPLPSDRIASELIYPQVNDVAVIHPEGENHQLLCWRKNANIVPSPVTVNHHNFGPAPKK